MNNWEWLLVGIAIGAGALLLLVVLTAWARLRRRRKRLRNRFGPEYYRAVSTSGKRQAERRLASVEHQHEELPVRSLPPTTRERYLDEWHQAETRFVSDPADAARSAERLVAHVLEELGYPAGGSIDEHAAHIAADFPDVAERYRHGRTVLASRNGGVDTESLRKAMIDFRTVLDELLTPEPTAQTSATG